MGGGKEPGQVEAWANDDAPLSSEERGIFFYILSIRNVHNCPDVPAMESGYDAGNNSTQKEVKMFSQKSLRVYILMLVVAFIALAMLVGSANSAVASQSFPGNPGIIAMRLGGTWLVQPHVAFPTNPGDPTSSNYPTNPC